MQHQDRCEDIIQAYSNRFGDKDFQSGFGLDHQAFPWHSTEDKVKQGVSKQTVALGEEVKAQLEEKMGLQAGALDTADPLSTPLARSQVSKDTINRSLATMSPFYNMMIKACTIQEEDSDGEVVTLCQQCNLPLGDTVYSTMHAECYAQAIVKDMHNDERKRLADERKEKDARHAEFGIGWKAEFIPSNQGPVAKLAMCEVSDGMICLVRDESSGSISIASTTEPAAAVNLEYLSTSLEVRRKEGHEPVFSLDPIGTNFSKHAMQLKTFIPEWLADTSAGDVLFQADYHLKELSMGEYEQPVVGMKSCFDLSDEQMTKKEWSAREWFVVRKAEVQICDGEVLIPFIKMGIEAREQVVDGDTLVDKAVTRLDHPMVKYAESFTRNFDLIAERKSVIHHLRELAKAAVLAKHLLESRTKLDGTWFQMAAMKSNPRLLQVPQLWNERLHSSVQLVDDSGLSLKGSEADGRVHGVYGGVQFGLEKFDLSASRSDRRPLAPASALSAISAAKGIMPQTLSAGPQPQSCLRRPLYPDITPDDAGRLVPRKPAADPADDDAVDFSATSVASATLHGEPAPEVGIPRMSPMAGLKARLAGRTEPWNFTQKDGLAPSATITPVQSLRSILTGPLAGATPKPQSSTHEVPEAARPAPTSVGVRPAPPTAGFMKPEFATLSADAEQLQGVDLRLDSFDLSVAKRISPETQSGSWRSIAQPLQKCEAVGHAFWTSLNAEPSDFKDEDKALLRSIFNPHLSDRRMEGAAFVPPDASCSHVSKLKALVKEEEYVRNLRRQLFLSKQFLMSDPGRLFPSSWSSTVEFSQGDKAMLVDEGRQPEALAELPQYQSIANKLLQGVLKTSVPVFDKSTEDGMNFRIYRMGSLEVRTTKQINAPPEIGVIFNIGDHLDQQCGDTNVGTFTNDKIVKCTEYVERIHRPGHCGHRRYYVVFETEHRRTILTQLSEDGQVIFEQASKTIEERNALAKVLKKRHCERPISVADLKHQASLLGKEIMASSCASKNFAKAMCRLAVGEVPKAQQQESAAPQKLKKDVARRSFQNQALAEREATFTPVRR